MLGTTYEFTVESRNDIAFSEPSTSVTILHAIPPEKPATPTTANSGQDIIIDWVAPSENGDTISSYAILIRHADGTTFSEEKVNCDGADAGILAATTCTVPITKLREAPFSLTVLDEVHVKLYATNIKGDSLESDVGSGAIIIQPPDAPRYLSEVSA